MSSQRIFNLYFFRLLLVLVTLGLFGALSAIGIFFYLSMDLPDVNTLQNYQPSIPSQILSRDGLVLMEMGLENRELVSIKDIPDVVKNAFLASEDSEFYHHKGVDYMGMIRAFIVNFKAGRLIQGGSTITQQVAKQLLLTRERSIVRKVKDIILAQRIEQVFTKDQILYLYLNHVYLGAGFYGIKAAIRGHYDIDLKHTNASQAALMAGLLVAPGKISPYLRPEYAKRRQNYVLRRMRELGHITQEQYDIEMNRSLKIMIKRPSDSKAGYFTEWIRQKIMKDLGPELILNGGLKIHTTIDLELQNLAQMTIRHETSEIDKRKGYHGPIKNLYTQEAIVTHLIEQRRSLLQEQSKYFMLTPSGEKKYEKDLSKIEELKLRNYIIDSMMYVNLNKKIPNKLFNAASTSTGLDITELIDPQEKITAVVTAVDDQRGQIFISMGGINGVIPREYFSWCHPRAKDDSRSYFPPMNTPSKIVNKGDLIYVKFKKMQTTELDNQSTTVPLFSIEQNVEVQGALMAMDPIKGDILAMVGGRDFRTSQFNRALQSKRQPGSAFKPIVYACALENGYHPARILMDTPEALGGQDSSMFWKPKNYDGKFMGPMSLRRAFELSRNIPMVKVAENLGLRKLHRFTERIGMQATMPSDLTVVLGSFGMTLLDLVTTYAIFPGGGKRVRPVFISKIVRPNGEVITLPNQLELPTKNIVLANEINSKNPFFANLNEMQVYDERLAYLMTNLLQSVINHGTGQKTRDISDNIAGKTGTTNRFVDAWFTGFSSNVVTSVWFGMDNNESLGWGESGTKAALPAWKAFMKKVVEKYGDIPFSRPAGIVELPINSKTGRLVTAGVENVETRTEVFADVGLPGQHMGGVQSEVDAVDGTKDNTEMVEEDDYFSVE